MMAVASNSAGRTVPRSTIRFAPLVLTLLTESQRAVASATSWHHCPAALAFTFNIFKIGPPSHPRGSPAAGRSRKRAFPGVMSSTEAGEGLKSEAFRLVQLRESVELQTAVYRVSPETESRLQLDHDQRRHHRQTEIILVSMVHLADRGYYRKIMREASSYDRVLFELVVGSEISQRDEAGRKSVIDYVFPTREQELLARNYGLAPQLSCLNYRHLCMSRAPDTASPRWVLADLSRDEIRALQRAAGENAIGRPVWQGFLDEVTRALVVGRQAGDKILPKFFPPLGSSLNRPALVLRALLWLAPCPEAEIMLLDWARTYPRAGGLSALASAIVERVLAGDFFTARKLGFAQQIVSGQAGGGNWGASDDVIVRARNEVVVHEAERALDDGCQRVMVLYGGLHMKDLTSRLCERLNATSELEAWRTAWVVPTKSRSRQVATMQRDAIPATSEESTPEREAHVGMLDDDMKDSTTSWGPLAVAALAYVAVGAWDWTDTIETLARDLTTEAAPAETLTSALLVTALYVARHAYLYYGLARWLVQWEERLF